MKKNKKSRSHFWQRNSVFTTTFLSLSLMSLFTVIVMFILINWVVTSDQAERIQDLNESQLQRAGDDFDTRLEMLEQSMSQVINSSDFISIMVNPSQVDSDKTTRIVSTLSSSVSQNALVEEAFFYLPTSEKVYSSSGDYVSRDNSSYQEVIDEYLEIRAEGRSGGSESESSIFYADGKLLIATDFAVPNFLGVIFYSVSLDELASTLSGEDGDIGDFLILGGDGSWIVGDETVGEIVARALEAGEYLSISSGDTDGDSAEVLLYDSGISDLSYVLYVDPAASSVSLGTAIWMIILFILIYAVFAEVFALYITRNIYRPINRLMQITAKERNDLDKVASAQNRNELVYLEEAFQDTLKENTQHKELLVSISHDVAEQTFRSILNGKNVSAEYIASTLQGIGLEDFSHGRYMVLAGMLVMDKNRELSAVEVGLYKRSLVNLLGELGGTDYIISPFFEDKEILAVVLCFREESSVIQVKHCVTECVETVNQFTENLPYSVAFGKGKVYNDIASLRFSWHEAVEEVHYMFYMSEEPESEAPVLDKMTDDYDKRYFMERGHQVADAAEKERQEDAEKMANAMICEIIECSPENRQIYWELAVDVIVEKMIDSHITSAEIEAMKLNQMLQEISAMEDTEQIRKTMETFFSQAIRAIHNSSRKNRYRYVETAKEYIAAHYSDGNLSLNEVSDAIGISAPYLSGVFNEINQGSFSSYVKNYRITQAKYFLEQTTHSVSEIGYKCGFNSAQSFSRAFKKETGFSPGRYRDYRLSQRTEGEE
ncbi:MAG: AraC family transcriptional regulator [Lachnospiraceae bacterium]|nr:AraC family transcriptional regulator [Lachnospiraceae bacterium]